MKAPMQEPGQKYRKTLQTKAINALQKSTKKEREKMKNDIISGEGFFKTCGVTVTIQNVVAAAEPKKYTGTVKRLFEFILCKMAETGGKERRIFFTLTEYMEATGLKDRKTARQQVNKALAVIDSFRLEWTGRMPDLSQKTGKKKKPSAPTFNRMNVTSGSGGFIPEKYLNDPDPKQRITKFYVTFDYDFMNWLPKFGYMYIPEGYFKMNPHTYPNAANITRGLCEYLNMNKKTEARVSVRTLERWAECLPSKKEVQDKLHRDYKNRIIYPLDDTLRQIRETCGVQWHYCKKGGEPLTAEDVKNMSDIDEFEELFIEYSFPGMPGREEN